MRPRWEHISLRRYSFDHCCLKDESQFTKSFPNLIAHLCYCLVMTAAVRMSIGCRYLRHAWSALSKALRMRKPKAFEARCRFSVGWVDIVLQSCDVYPVIYIVMKSCSICDAPDQRVQTMVSRKDPQISAKQGRHPSLAGNVLALLHLPAPSPVG
jgi:hypothetical protein